MSGWLWVSVAVLAWVLVGVLVAAAIGVTVDLAERHERGRGHRAARRRPVPPVPGPRRGADTPAAPVEFRRIG